MVDLYSDDEDLVGTLLTNPQRLQSEFRQTELLLRFVLGKKGTLEVGDRRGVVGEGAECHGGDI
jgi:hypothetical protein